MRLELGNGQWAELRERLTYGQAQPLRSAMGATKQDWAHSDELTDAFLVAYVESWHVLDLNGNPVTFEDRAQASDTVIQDVVLKAAELWKGMKMPVPKAGSARSRSSQRALRSA